MSLAEPDAYTRLRDAARRVDAALTVDRPSIRWMDSPYAGVSYGLSLGTAHALLFLPADDIEAPGWETRLPARLEAAHKYLQGFTRVAG